MPLGLFAGRSRTPTRKKSLTFKDRRRILLRRGGGEDTVVRGRGSEDRLRILREWPISGPCELPRQDRSSRRRRCWISPSLRRAKGIYPLPVLKWLKSSSTHSGEYAKSPGALDGLRGGSAASQGGLASSTGSTRTTAPICRSMSSRSPSIQFSTILPSTTLSMVRPVNLTSLPVGAIPMNSPLWVP